MDSERKRARLRPLRGLRRGLGFGKQCGFGMWPLLPCAWGEAPIAFTVLTPISLMAFHESQPMAGHMATISFMSLLHSASLPLYNRAAALQPWLQQALHPIFP